MPSFCWIDPIFRKIGFQYGHPIDGSELMNQEMAVELSNSEDVNPNRMSRELAIFFYTKSLYLPKANFGLLIGIVLPLIDFGTDYYNS